MKPRHTLFLTWLVTGGGAFVGAGVLRGSGFARRA